MALTALTVNVIIGSGIFGIPTEVAGLLGRASPLAFILCGLTMAGIAACFAETASHFPEHGGPYLYVGRAFGRLPGVLTAWFSWLSELAAAAASANLFIAYASGFIPGLGQGLPRVAALLLLIIVPTVANYTGIRNGSMLSVVFSAAKLLPLLLLIAFGFARFGSHPELLRISDVTAAGSSNWIEAILLLVFAYGGCEDAVVPMGEVKNPQRNAPIALGIAFLIVIFVYTSLQFVTVATLGTTAAERPLAAVGAALMGRGGATLITIAAMLSTYGYITGMSITLPRLMFSFSRSGDFPAVLGRLHPRFQTPSRCVITVGVLVSVLAITGTFRWALALTAASMMILYTGVCAALLRLRSRPPVPGAVRWRFTPFFAVYGILLCMVLLSRLHAKDWILLFATAVLATLNWLWARRKQAEKAPLPIAA